MRKTVKIFIVLNLISLLVCTLVGCKGGSDMFFEPKKDLLRGYAVVHDPSVFYDEVTEKYYAFGSHFAVASSSDLITWKQEVYENHPEKLFGTKDFRSILVKADEFNGRDGNINSTWAPDVIKYGDKYYMYLALTSAFGKGKSTILRVSSDNVLGPYANEEVLIYSHDLWWEEPNAIDPELFYDKNGKLWMVYGSYFAGIYVKELYNSGEKFGLPIEEGFGKKICWDGYSSGVEGPFIFYSQETDYFYLMVSEGNLGSNYNMRIARSKNPDGPYYDASGNDVVTREGKGNKLAGNFIYNGENYSHVALGHNSVIKKDGEYFCVYHERVGIGTQIFDNYTIKTRKLIFSNNGWPLLAPNEYLGEKEMDIAKSEVYGEYDLIIHNEETIDDAKRAENYIFSETGAIILNGEKVGAFVLKNDNYITLRINGVKYDGKLVYNYVKHLEKSTISITAVSENGLQPLSANKVA